MPTNLALDDRLILEVKKAGNHKTKKEAVTAEERWPVFTIDRDFDKYRRFLPIRIY